MRDTLQREMKLSFKVDVYQRDRHGNEIPRRIRFWLLDRWFEVPGELVNVDQSRRDSPTLFTHTLFGSKAHGPYYTESDLAAAAAVTEYLRRGIQLEERLQGDEIIAPGIPEMTDELIHGNALWYLLEHAYETAREGQDMELAEAVARMARWFNALGADMVAHINLAEVYSWPLNEDEEPYQYEPLVPAAGEAVCPKCRNLVTTDDDHCEQCGKKLRGEDVADE